MNINVESYMNNVEPKQKARKSKLAPFQEAILTLESRGYSLDQILDFLNQNGVQTSKSNLSVFIKLRIGTIELKKEKITDVMQRVTQPVVNDDKRTKQDTVNELEGSSNKFDWQTPINAKEWM